MTRVYFMAGIQGSGKTTFAKKFAEKQGLVYISPDDLRYDQYPEVSRPDEAGIWREARLQIKQAMKLGKDVILDSTMASKSGRQTNINFIRAIDPQAEINCIHIMTDLATAVSRNDLRENPIPFNDIKNFHSRLESNPPTEEEGFAHVIHLDSECNPISDEDREVLSQITGELRSEFKPKIS